MTIGNIGTVGIHAAANYTPEVEKAKQVSQISLEQANSRDIILRDNNAETVLPIEKFEPDMGEKPDFAAINLMKNSFPEPVPQGRMQSFSLEDFETGASSKPDEPQMNLEDFRALQEARAEARQENSTQNVHEAVEGQGAPQQSQEGSAQNSFVMRNSQGVQTPQNTQAPEPTQIPSAGRETVKIEERMSETATVQTSYDMEQERAGSQLTPAQQRGVEEYERAANYVDPINVSTAGTQMVA